MVQSYGICAIMVEVTFEDTLQNINTRNRSI